MSRFSFEITAQDKKSRARTGILHTAHGTLETPYLIPVATRGKVVSLSPADIKELKVDALLANTYHLHLKPGDTIIKKQGGLHGFMSFKKPIFTDSGGFQAFSLGVGRDSGGRKIGFFPGTKNKSRDLKEKLVRITNKGVWFTSVYDGKKYFMGPKESMKIQSNLGADVIMAFDECTSAFADKKEIARAMARSHAWEKQSLRYYDKKQALYGIVHGGWFKDLRVASAKYINALPFHGLAIGGSLGRTKEHMGQILDWVMPHLDARPKHMLGIGWVDDIFECVERGIDTFDCVEMTRIARHGHLYISPKAQGCPENKFRIAIGKQIYAKDKKAIDPSCACPTCSTYTRAQLRTLFKTKHPDYARAATMHNIWFMHALLREIRIAIKKDSFAKLKKYWLA